MADIAPKQVVAAPARVPAPYGLFSVLSFRETAPQEEHWSISGVEWEAIEAGSELGIMGPIQVDRDTTAGLPKEFKFQMDRGLASVVTIYGSHTATPIAWGADRSREAARLKLTTLEERTLESLVWGATSGLATNLDADDSALGAADDILMGIALLERHLSDEYASRGVIHLSRAQAVYGIAQKALETRGSGLFTRVGTPVVAGQGYLDDKIFASSAIIGYRTEIIDATDRPYDGLDRSNNNLLTLAERTYCIGFEPGTVASVTIPALNPA